MFPTIITGIMVPIMLFTQLSVGSGPESKTLASHVYSLDNRYPDESVNTVFKDNILLTLNYLSGASIDKTHINWPDIEKRKTYTLALKPGETFAFHDDVLPE